MTRRLAALFALAFALFSLSTTTAHGYGAVQEPGTVSAGTVESGGSVSFSGDGFAAGAELEISVSFDDGSVDDLGTVDADDDGAFATEVTLDRSGVAVLSATGADADGGVLTVTAEVRVLAASSGDDGADDDGAGGGDSAGGLPRTGADGLGAQVWMGVGLLALGGGLVALTVSRRRTTA